VSYEEILSDRCYRHAVAGALAAVAVYLHRREKELDEYERLLFGEDKAETVEPAAEQPAEDTSAEDAAE
jgi:hypothetical protein